MKKILTVFVLFLLTAFSANAAMLWYEGFTNQTVGSALTDDGNWSYSGSPDDMPLISSGSLSYGELQASAGNSITTITNAQANAGSAAKREYDDQTGPLYASFLMRVHNLTGLTTEHKKQIVGLHLSGYNGIALRRNATYSDRFDILLSPNDDSTDFTADDNGGAGYATNETFLLVFGTEDADAAAAFNLWVNPTALGGSAPAADVSETLKVRATTAQIFHIYANHSGVAGSNSPVVQLDEIRVGTSYADVTPLSPGYSLSAAPNNPLWGSVSPTNGYFEPGTNVTLTATASNHYHFVNWSGSISGSSAVTNIVMDANKTITANFEADPYVLTVVSAHGSPSPAGTVTNAYGTVLTNSVNTPVVNGFTQYICTGWTLTGNAPVSGSSNEFVMTLTNTPATLTWLWETNAITDPIIGYAPSSLSFSHTLGAAAPVSKTYVVTNIGAGSLTLSNLANVSWLDVSPATLSGLSNGQSATVTVSVVTNGLSAGTSNGVITLSSPNADNSPQQVSVQLGIYESSQSGWPVYGQNNDRTFYSAETVSFPLEKSWVFKSQKPVPTRTTISTQAGRAHFYPVRYDYAPSPVAVGGSVYLNAVTEEAVYCLDSATGATNWTYYTEGPVRVAPAVYDGKVYFGSDDGHAYCVNAADGSLIWKVSASTNEYRAVTAHRISSAWPVRTGVAVESNKAYFAGGTLPTHGCYLVCVDADDGELNWRTQAPFPMQGPILLNEDRVFVGTGRVFPVEYDKATGTCINDDPDGFNREMGGGPAGHTVAGLPYWGPSENGTIAVRVTTDFIDSYFSTAPEARVTGSFAYLEANQLLADEDTVYILHESEDRHTMGGSGPDVPRGLIAVPKSIATNEMFQSADNHTARDGASAFHLGASRGGANFSEPVMMLNMYSNRDWIVEGTDNLRGLVTANAIFLGGTNQVAAYNPDTGAQLWTRSVTGAVWELAFADGVLYAGTREGYVYAFENGASGTVDETRSFSSPYPTNDALYDVYAEAAQLAITNSGATRGFCLVLGAGDGRLAYEIAQRSDLFVIGLETDSATASAARQKLTQAGVYGTQVVIHEDMDELFPHPDYFADLIVSEELLTDGTMPYSSREIFRMLRPYGGTVLFGNKDGNLDLTSWVGDDMTAWSDVASSQGVTWKIAERGEPDGFGSWNFQMADPGNSFASGDRLVGADLRLQWIGEVNDELALDRHNLPGSPLAYRGRLFINHLDHLTVVDAYNGTIIWEKSIEQTLRQIASHDAPNLCAVGDEIYVATSNSCHVFDARTGEALRSFTGPSAADEWGYVGVYSNMLIASKQQDGASVRVAGDPKWLYEQSNGGSWPIVSKNLFALNPASGTQLWIYTNGVILNQSIAIGGTNIFFVESRNSTAVNDADGRVALTDFLSSQAYCVALDINTGSVVWEQALDGRMSTDPGHDVALFLSFHSNRLVSTGSWWDNTDISTARALYRLTVRDPSDGSIVGTPLTMDVGDRGGGNTTDHNDTLMRPACTMGKAFYRFYDTSSSLTVLNLDDGTTNRLVFSGQAAKQKGCTPLSVSYDTAYYRAYAIEGANLITGQVSPLTDVSRPSCWPSIIPAGGLLLMPEGSSGCFCGMAEQTSLALAPILSDTNAPGLFNVVALDENTVTVVFDEALEKTVAEDESHYSINNGITVLSAVRQTNHLERVTLTVSSMAAGTNTLTVSGLEDLHGNVMSGSQQMDFESGAADTDEDGLPDSWEEQYFENSTAADPNEDSDNDGLSNYDEYIAGTSPVDPFSVLLVEDIINAPGNGYVVTWTPQAGRTYNVLWTSNLLSNFQTLETGIAYPQASWTDTLHNAQDGGFYKIEAEME